MATSSRRVYDGDANGWGSTPLTVARFVGSSLEMIQKHYGHLVRNAARDKLAALSFL